MILNILGQVDTLIQEINNNPEITDKSNIISLTSNEIADILLKITKEIRKDFSVDVLLENIVNILCNAGIAERVLLFQVKREPQRALLTHYCENGYVSTFNPIGFQLDLLDAPMFKLFDLSKKRNLQVEDMSKYIKLPNYLFRNKFKALFIKLKSRSILLNAGSNEKITAALSLQFSTKCVVWSNEVEKLVQSVVDQVANAIEQHDEKRKKELLKKDIIQLQEKAIREQEELLRCFASDIHDLPCSIIPNLKQAIKTKDFEECERLVDELYNNLRQLMNEYVVPDISLLGFGSTIYQFINGFRKTFKGKVLLSMPQEDLNISQKKAIEIFKVIKEWFCNIEKHSYASEVDFSLEKLNEDYILISISDNGRGFDIGDNKNLGYGMLNMKNRLSELNSKYEIKSKLGEGSIIRIQMCTV